MAQGGTHPTYTWRVLELERFDGPSLVLLGDDVARAGGDLYTSLGAVTDIHGETFGDGTGDTITVIPAAVTLSTGDRYDVAGLVLLRRAEA